MNGTITDVARKLAAELERQFGATPSWPNGWPMRRTG